MAKKKKDIGIPEAEMKRQASVIKALQSRLAKKEGKKSQISMGDAREVIGIISDELYQDEISGGPLTLYIALMVNGLKRSKKKVKK